MREQIVNVAKSPLVHFLIIGTGIYLAYAAFGTKQEAPGPDKITVTSSEIGWLVESWQKRWNRPPTDAERQGLVEQYVRETVLYREALAMGLDKDDTIIRRRLAQKLEFLTDDLASIQSPSDEDLETYFAENAERYQTPAMITFAHVFFDVDQRGINAEQAALDIKVQLEAREHPAEDVEDVGDPFMLQRYYPERTQAEIQKLFGRRFAVDVFGLEPRRWHGPVQSGYGLHLVFVHQREDARSSPFTEVRERVAQDWQEDRRQEVSDQYFAGLLKRYQVVIEDYEPPERVAMVSEESL